MTGNTARSFRDEWEMNIQAFYGETLRSGSDTQNWILARNGFASADEFSSHLLDRRRILDAGCGNGRVTLPLKNVLLS